MNRHSWTLVISLLLLAVAVLFWPAGVDHGPDDTPVRVGILHPTKVDVTTFNGFKRKMSELGYREGENIVYLYPGPAGKGDQLIAAAEKMVATGVDLIFSSSTPATKAAKIATRETGVPVVFGPVNDPVAAGVVESLKYPGGNVTGVTLPASGGKRFEWLSRLKPDIRHVLFIHNVNSKSSQASLVQAREGSAGTAIHLSVHEIGSTSEISDLLSALPDSVEAIYLPRDAFITSQIELIAAAAIRERILLSTPGLIQVEAGALYSYGFEHFAVGEHAAVLADRIIHGNDPAQTPVEVARSFFFFNMATAQAIGLKITDQTIRQAKKIIR